MTNFSDVIHPHQYAIEKRDEVKVMKGWVNIMTKIHVDGSGDIVPVTGMMSEQHEE